MILIAYVMHCPLLEREDSEHNLNCSSWFRKIIMNVT